MPSDEAASRTAQALLLRRMFDTAIASAQPALCIPAHLPAPAARRLAVIGAGEMLTASTARKK